MDTYSYYYEEIISFINSGWDVVHCSRNSAD